MRINVILIIHIACIQHCLKKTFRPQHSRTNICPDKKLVDNHNYTDFISSPNGKSSLVNFILAKIIITIEFALIELFKTNLFQHVFSVDVNDLGKFDQVGLAFGNEIVNIYGCIGLNAHLILLLLALNLDLCLNDKG